MTFEEQSAIYKDSNRGISPKDIADKYGISLNQTRDAICRHAHFVNATPAQKKLYTAVYGLPSGYAIYLVLRRANINTLAQLKKYDVKKLKEVKGLGNSYINTLKNAELLK